MKKLFLISFCIFLFSCNQQKTSLSSDVKQVAANYDSNNDKVDIYSGKMNEIFQSDSAVFMFYNTPGNPRFFTYTKVKNMKSLINLFRNVNNPISDSLSGCVTQGKIYFYEGKEAVYPVYFNNIDSCATFSYIKTGEKYYTKMDVEPKLLLDSLKKIAK
jgi:hypothetical protein